jgi:tetratricopeptide (TPR) repeat protein
VDGRILARRGRFEEAKHLTQEGIDISERTDFGWRADLYVDMWDVLRLAGDADGARKSLERALALYEEKGNVVLAERTKGLLGRY